MDPVNFLYKLWALPNEENLPINKNLSAFLVAYKNGDKIGHARITRREDLPRKVKGFVTQYGDGCNISYVPHLFDATRYWSKDSLDQTKTFVIDLDLYKLEKDLEDPEGWIFDRLSNYNLPKPHFIVNTSEEGRQLVWLTYIESVDEQPKLIEHIDILQDKFSNQIFECADDIHPVQAFRLPGTKNQKEGRDNYRVNYTAHADPEEPYGFYTNLFGPVYGVPNLTDEELKEMHNPDYEAVEDPLEHPVIEAYRERLSNYSGYNIGKHLTGAVLALKAVGEGESAVKDRILSWIDGEHEEELEKSIDYAFSGSGAGGQLEGKGWDHRKANLKLPEWRVKDFYNYIPEVKRKTNSKKSYQDLSERQRRLISYFLRQEEDVVAKSFKEVAEGAGISESTLRYDVKNDNLPYFLDATVRHGQTTVWQLWTPVEVNSAKTALDNAYVGAVGGSDSTTISVKPTNPSEVKGEGSLDEDIT